MRTIFAILLTIATANANQMQHCMHKARKLCRAEVNDVSTTTTTLPCTFTVLPYEGNNTQPDFCEQTPSYCIVVNGCGYIDAVYCPETEVMDHCAYRSTCDRLY